MRWIRERGGNGEYRMQLLESQLGASIAVVQAACGNRSTHNVDLPMQEYHSLVPGTKQISDLIFSVVIYTGVRLFDCTLSSQNKEF